MSSGGKSEDDASSEAPPLSFSAEEMARLKRAYDEGMASGVARAIDRDAFLAELKAEKRARG